MLYLKKYLLEYFLNIFPLIFEIFKTNFLATIYFIVYTRNVESEIAIINK